MNEIIHPEYPSYLSNLILILTYREIIPIKQEIDDNVHLTQAILRKTFDQSIMNVSIERYCFISAELLVLEQLYDEKTEMLDVKQVKELKAEIETEREALRKVIEGSDEGDEKENLRKGGTNPYSFEKFDKKFAAFSVEAQK